MPTPLTLHKDITAGRFKQAYYFFGEEDYRMREAEKFVASQFLPDRQAATNLYKIDGRQTKAPDLMAKLANLPMLGEKQVFFVRDFQSYKPTEITRVLELLSPPDPNRIIIFSSPSTRTPKRNSAFLNSMSKVAEVIEFKRLTFEDTAGQIRGRLQKEGIAINPDALRMLAELLGGSRGAMEVEIGKLINFKSSGETVEIEDIKKISAGYEVFGIFDLADYVVAGNTRKVLQMVRTLLSEGNSPATLTTLMQQHFSSLYLVKHGKNPIGNRDRIVYKLKRQADRYSNERLEDIIIEIADADKMLRHKGIKPETTLEMLAMTLAGENKPQNG
ncbi:MAG: DNA polymerase III subunit delta [Candidatus Zixiibacteriota bacterium]